MKQRTLLLALASVAMTAFFSCSNDELQDSSSGEVRRIVAQLPAFLDEDTGTRTQINVDAADNIGFTWAVGDMLGIFPDKGIQTYFELDASSLSADGKTATFDGGGWALKLGRSYYAYYPYDNALSDIAVTPSSIPLSYEGQSITSWTDRKSAAQYDFNVSPAAQSQSGVLSFAFKRMGALLRLKVELPATATYQSLTLSTDADLIPVSGTVNLTATTPAYTATAYAKSVSLDLADVQGTKGESVFLYVMLPAMTLRTQGKELTATLSYDNGKTMTYNLCKAGKTDPHTPDFAADYIYKRDLVATSVNPGGEISGGNQEEDDDTHAYVDLGLPSHLKWATCNVGASTPEEYGDYFAWGETVGYLGGKTTFNWSTCPFRTSGDSWDNVKFSKYVTKSSYGTVDNKKVLESADDAATQSWGGSWRMPTHEEWKELVKNTSNKWTSRTTASGTVYGYEFTGNGQTLFLPAAGYRYGTNVNYAGSNGDYWSSSLYESDPYGAWLLYFGSGYVDADSYNLRCYGRSVRPVCP